MLDMNTAMPIVWVALIIIFAVAEAFTLGLTSIWFSLGSIFALLAALLGLPLFAQIFVFLIATLVMLIYTRPVAKKYLRIGASKTNVSALIGVHGIVVKPIEQFQTGQVKVKGQIWTAKSYDGVTLEQDTEIEVLAVEGVKLIVQSTEMPVTSKETKSIVEETPNK